MASSGPDAVSVPAAAATREDLIASLSRHFSEDIDGMLGEIVADSDGLTREQIDSVRSRFQSAFDSVVGTGFDVVFRKELSERGRSPLCLGRGRRRRPPPRPCSCPRFFRSPSVVCNHAAVPV